MANKQTVMKKAPPTSSPNLECCMCGDYGLLNQLFQCTECLFRSQHRYCSNIYPGTESAQVCNWCLNKHQESTERAHSSSISSSSSCNNNKKKESTTTSEGNSYADRGNNNPLRIIIKSPIKKSRSEEKLFGRLKMSSCDIKKELFKGKAQKYKLLADVCR